VVPVSRPVAYLGGGDIGCSSTVSRRGARNLRGRRPAFASGPVPFTRRCSAHAARRSNSPSSLPPPRRAPPSAPSSPRKRRRPRKGYAERVDRRHGSLASSHDRRKTRSRSSRTKAVSALAPDRQNSQRVETSVAGERGGALPGIERMVRIIWAVQAAQAVSGRDRQRSCWRAAARRSFASGQPYAKANADRGGSLARRRIHGSRACPRVEHALQRSVVQSQPREARLKLRRLGAGALYQPRVNHASGSRRVGGGSGRG
jgi:hypothetical protein